MFIFSKISAAHPVNKLKKQSTSHSDKTKKTKFTFGVQNTSETGADIEVTKISNLLSIQDLNFESARECETTETLQITLQTLRLLQIELYNGKINTKNLQLMQQKLQSIKDVPTALKGLYKEIQTRLEVEIAKIEFNYKK